LQTLRQELMVGLHHLNPQVVFADLIRHVQKLMDRLLFIAFAESRNLLPKGAQASLGDKLGAWWLLPDLKAFSFEVSKRFKPTFRCANATTGSNCLPRDAPASTSCPPTLQRLSAASTRRCMHCLASARQKWR
jgi:hypothetical protein